MPSGPPQPTARYFNHSLPQASSCLAPLSSLVCPPTELPGQDHLVYAAARVRGGGTGQEGGGGHATGATASGQCLILELGLSDLSLRAKGNLWASPQLSTANPTQPSSCAITPPRVNPTPPGHSFRTHSSTRPKRWGFLVTLPITRSFERVPNKGGRAGG